MGNPTSSALVPATIQAARIIDVDPVNWTCTLRTEVGERRAGNVPIPSVYAHPFAGEGMHHMPEIGATVWAAWPSEGVGDSKALIINYRGMSSQGGNHRANRPFMIPGDLALITRDNNGVKIRRGGVVEIYSTPLARTFYLPNSNEVLTFAENWKVETLGGFLRFTTARAEEDPLLQSGTRFDLSAKEFAEHPRAAVDLKIGGQIEQAAPVDIVPVIEGDPTMLDLRVWQDSTSTKDLEEDPPRESVSLTMNRKGELDLATYQPAPEDPLQPLFRSSELKINQEGDIFDLQVFVPGVEENSVHMTINRTGELKLDILPTGQVTVFSGTDELTEGVILGKTFLSELKVVIDELTGIINALGFPTPLTEAFMLTKLEPSIVEALPKGGPPLVSVHLRTD